LPTHKNSTEFQIDTAVGSRRSRAREKKGKEEKQTLLYISLGASRTDRRVVFGRALLEQAHEVLEERRVARERLDLGPQEGRAAMPIQLAQAAHLPFLSVRQVLHER
jgi:hypothetical protein